MGKSRDTTQSLLANMLDKHQSGHKDKKIVLYVSVFDTDLRIRFVCVKFGIIVKEGNRIHQHFRT